MLTYTESLDFIHGIARFGSKLGLERVKNLLERIGNPQNKLRFIHVAGTNGKGSTCAMLSSILTGAGYKTGLYISPFVVDFRERIQINNEMIPPDELALSTTMVKEHWDVLDAQGDTPSEFEVVAAVAFDYFARQGCDIVVLEVGMGGRLDATNVIGCPLVSVITSISVDHTEYLGDTLEKIAYEKCGIIKENGVTVSYARQAPEALAVIMERCGEENNRLLMGNSAEVLHADIFGSHIRYDDLEVHIPLAGEHQVWNTVIVLETVKALALSGISLRPEQVAAGIAATRFPSRLEVLCKQPLVLLDGAHNLAGAEALATTLEQLAGRRVHTVIGMLADKEVDACMAAILPHCASVITVAIDNSRAMSAERLAELAGAYCRQVTTGRSGREAVTEAFDRCVGDDALLVCGSLYLASEIRPILLEIIEFGINKIK